ncbi:hypothetical protein FKM82_013191 [Ascaphus truei]
MINTVWESGGWQLDMQLVGKLAVSATALLILALAYRFYKSRVFKRRGIPREDASGATREDRASFVAAQWDYLDDEPAGLRFRLVNSNLRSSIDSSPETKHLAGNDTLDTQEFHRGSLCLNNEERGNENSDLIYEHQKTEKSCVIKELHGIPDPLQRNGQNTGTVHVQNLKDTTGSNQDLCDSTTNIDTLSENFTQDLEAKEMHDNVDLDKGVQQSIMGEESKIELIGEIENPDVGTSDKTLAQNNSPQKELPQHSANTRHRNIDNGETTELQLKSEGMKTESDSMGYIPSVMELSHSNLSNNNKSHLQFVSGSATFHVSLSPGLTSDINLDLGNCYEVLCLAKKHNLDILKTAAYQVMSNNFLQVLQNPSVYGRLNAAERDLVLENRMKGRRFVVVADTDTQDYSISQNTSSLSYYDNENDLWYPLSHIPVEAVSRGCAMASMFNYLFVVLGCEGSGRQMKPSKRVFCYNPLADTWSEISPLNEGRPHCKLVALNGCLYAIGGECLHTVEQYDPRQDSWSYIAPLPHDTFAVAHMATAYDDEIYVTGGTIRYMLLRYHDKENVWRSSLISGSKNRTTEMVAVNNFLYRFDLNRSMGISVHRCSIRVRIWYECASYAMPYPTGFQCAVTGNIIYCISRNFHVRFLADDISPRFLDGKLKMFPLPKGTLIPLVLVLPVKDSR